MSLYEIGHRLRGKEKRKSRFNVRAAVIAAVIVFLVVFGWLAMFSISLHNEWIEELEDYYSTEGISDPDFPELDLSMALYSGLTFALAAAIFFGLVW